MIPYKSIIKINRKSKQALYIQISNQCIDLIKKRVLTPGAKLPGSRTLAELLGVHRKTIISCYEELLMQGWVESLPQKGTFVHKDIPLLKQQKIADSVASTFKKNVGFSFVKDPVLQHTLPKKENGFMYLNDGVSDERLAPTLEISRLYRTLANKKQNLQYFGYGSTFGNIELRDVLVTLFKRDKRFGHYKS